MPGVNTTKMKRCLSVILLNSDISINEKNDKFYFFWGGGGGGECDDI